MILGISVFSFTSCGDDDDAPKPTVQILQATIEGYSVAFSIAAENADTYAWDFGDGGTSTDEEPLYTYTEKGTFTATVTVTGKGGTAEASKQVTVGSDLLDHLTGGPAMAEGKTWILDQTSDVIVIEAESGDLSDVDKPISAAYLAMFGLDDLFSETYTFKHDLSFNYNTNDDKALAATVYATYNNLTHTPVNAYPVITLADYASGSSTFSLTTDEELTLTTIADADFNDDTEETTYAGLPYVTISGNGYIGSLGYHREYLIIEANANKLVLGIFNYYPESEDNLPAAENVHPTHILQMTFIPVSE